MFCIGRGFPWLWSRAIPWGELLKRRLLHKTDRKNISGAARNPLSVEIYIGRDRYRDL